jgi:Tol biopolymer transport system component
VHLADLRQLTFGGENAEAYWSPDGRKLMFQWTPGEGTCDQQYVYDLTTGQVELVSSGKGRTTCGYFSYPDGNRLIYATTEGGGEQCPPTPDHSQGYVWAIYDSYDLVWQDGPDGKPTPFLANPGYDAEATACFKDGRVVFTSTRGGDLDLWTVGADGSDLRQVTSTPGYDGGAFFTPDCSEIVWRASRPEGEALADYQGLLKQGLVRPSKLDLYLMNADGTNVRRLTDNGSANFGPYPLPDASGFVFSSNMGGDPREFDIHLVSRDGGAPERVTYSPEFDGFPMFSPDGQWFVFASNRGGKNRETNLFVARWVK